MKNTKLQNLGIAVASVLVCFSLGAGAARAGDDRHDDNDKDGKFLLISFQENVTSFDGVNGTLDGTATFAGAFNDRCTRHENFHVVSADKNGNPNIAGTSTFFGTNGTLTTSFTGTIYFSADPYLSYVEGVESITGGTGPIYAAARGKGTFEATQDQNPATTPYKVVGVFEVNVKKDR
jgi:hypothetical protein